MRPRPAHPLLLERIGRLAQAGRVHDAERNTAQGEVFFDRIAGRPRNLADHGTVVAEEKIEQARFADIRAAVNDQTHTLAKHASFVRRRKQFLHARKKIIDPAGEGLTAFGIDPLFRKINEGLEVSQCHKGFLAQCIDLPPQSSLELGRRRLGRGFSPRGDQVHHRLRLGQIHLAIEKGASGEFARGCACGAGHQDGPQYPLSHDHAAVSANLDHILPRVAVRGTKDSQQDIINDRSLAHNLPAHDAPGHHLPGGLLSAKNLVRHLQRLRAADPDHGNRTGAHRRGQRGNRFRLLHQETLANVPRPSRPSPSISRSSATKV